MLPSSIVSLKILLNAPLMVGSKHSCLFHVCTDRTHFSLKRAILKSRCVINSTMQHGPVFGHKTVHSDMPYRSANQVLGESEKDDSSHRRLISLKNKLDKHGLRLEYYTPGQYNNLLCPKCLGGISNERSFSVHIRENGLLAVWKCFRSGCGWVGVAQGEEPINGLKLEKPKNRRKLTEQGLGLMPLNDYLINYFRERGISRETLKRNRVMQKLTRTGKYWLPIIAFTYRRDGVLVNCKYRKLPKDFWQVAGTEKTLYGLDDIKGESDIIIVEGEIDKLSMEEAGFRNCVSVPNGAPQKISNKDLPNKQADRRFQYVWNCIDYLKSASRIILATDADGPGQALAEELARRLGKEKCWRVKWPRRDEDSFCRDANEALVHLGKQALREVIENAEMYPTKDLFTFNDSSQDVDDFGKVTTN
ncbi:hypothetical protein LUZ60_017529 [Juncus effusus]|nr:hypothetical protein LUZ60_017529 [Juncus effusus]